MIAAHAEALADDAGPKSLESGYNLIAGFDAGCYNE